MTEPNPYTPTQAELLDADESVLLPGRWKRLWISLAFSYTAVVPILVYMVISGLGSSLPLTEFLIMPVLLILGGSTLILPSWFVVFLPTVLLANPRSEWVTPGFLAFFGALVGGGWGILANMDPELGGAMTLVFVACGAIPGFLYGRWNQRFLQRKPHA